MAAIGYLTTTALRERRTLITASLANQRNQHERLSAHIAELEANRAALGAAVALASEYLEDLELELSIREQADET